MKKLLSVLLVTALVLAALPLTALPAAAVTSGDFEYKVLSETDKTCEITDYTGSATALAIPSELDGYTVTSIGARAFYGCKSLTSITLPDSVTRIGWYAFKDCAALTSVTLPNSVTSIENYAFSGCTALESITIPNSVTSIVDSAFYGCTALTEIKVDTGNPNYTSESGVLFNRNKTALICYPAGKQDSSYIVPDSVTIIGGFAFYACTSLESITIPDSVTSIGGSAFYGCAALTSVTIPDSVTYIAYYAFEYCTALASASIGNGVRDIGDYAFSHCTSLTSITIPDSVTSIDPGAFYDCTALASITIPDSVTGIGRNAFDGCTALTSITIPNSVTGIGACAFKDCTALESITIPNSVTGIGDWAFYNTAYYNDATHWENDVLYIGNHLIEANDTLSGAYTVRAGTKTIAEYAFSNCTALTSITIPDSVTRIYYDAFIGCTLLTTIYGYTGSDAETFAQNNGYTFIALDLVKNDETDISVSFPPENLPAENTVLNVEKLSAEENTIIYDITLTVNDEIVQPASAVTVKIPVPAGMDGTQCKVYREEANGKLTDMHAQYQNGYMVFTTDHFSKYVVTTESLGVTPGDVNGDDKINAVDARWVLQAASGARTFDATQTAAADVNGDGKVNAVDARWILQVASGARTL